METKRLVAFAAGMIGALAVSGPAFAGNLADEFHSCVSKFANNHESASVMLQCDAANGKLSNCTVLNAPSPTNGFDKAAECVAEVLPIGNKTGSVKVPIRFQGQG